MVPLFTNSRSQIQFIIIIIKLIISYLIVKVIFVNNSARNSLKYKLSNQKYFVVIKATYIIKNKHPQGAHI